MTRALDSLEACVTAQRNLINDLLDLARRRTGIEPIGREPISLSSIVATVVNAMGPTANANNITVRMAIDARSVHQVVGDGARLRQVVGNLMSNAIKFTPAGGRITVALRRHNDDQILVVEDDGEGIEPAFVPHVFEAFRQQDSTTRRRYGGLGLGLSIARELVTLHGGTILAESAGQGRGSRFTVRLPDASGRAMPLGGETALVTPPVSTPTPLTGLRLMLIEDERTTREAIKIALEHCGATIAAFGSAGAGRAALRVCRPDVIMCDVAMPEEDGYSFVRGLRGRERRHGRRIPVLALTSYGGSEDRRKLLSSGFDLHVPKPVKTDDLVAAVLSLTGRRDRDRVQRK
jgi:hypothetical protein